MTITDLTMFFGWSSVIDIGILTFTFLILTVTKNTVARIHSGMFGLAEADLQRIYLEYMGRYKLLIFVFNVAPYFALKAMA